MTTAIIQTLWRQGEQFAARREWAQAREQFKAILQYQPGHANALLQLSYIESLSGHYRSARQYALQANQAMPRDEATIRELIARLRTFNEASALHGCLQRLPPLQQVGIPLLIACAAQLSYLNEQERALVFLDEAMRGDPDYPPTLLARGQVLTYLGRFEEAEQNLQQCMARAPQVAQAQWFLSRLRRQTPDANNVRRIRQQLLQGNRKAEETALLAYALHKELDDLGQYPEAIQALDLACRMKRSTLNYSVNDSQTLISELISFPTPPIPTEPAMLAANEPTPFFIIGMHRSGTTLLEQLLAGSPDVIGIGELYDFTTQMRLATDHHCRGVIDGPLIKSARGVDFGVVGRGYLAGVAWRLDGNRFFTDKLPSNFLNIGFICRALPQAKILHMVRDPVETCFSNLRELFSDANPYSYDQAELAHYYKQYQKLMAHWHRIYPGRILDVDYATLTRDPEIAMREVTRFCGLDFHQNMLELQHRKRGVATASAVQVRGKVVARERPKWEPYADYLQPLIRALQS